MGKRRSSNKKRWDTARVLALIGGLVALVGFAIGLVNAVMNYINIQNILLQVLGILLSLFVLIQVEIVKTNMNIPFKWWLLLILVCLQAVCASELGGGGFVSIAGLGLLLEAIAVILLILNAM